MNTSRNTGNGKWTALLSILLLAAGCANAANTPPTVVLSASPSTCGVGTLVYLSAIGTDPDVGQTLTYSYDYGDGNTGTSNIHSFAAFGTYSVYVTVSDGVATGAASTLVAVFGVNDAPIARITLSDNTIYVGVPVTFDAVTSNDPQNTISTYTWDFGDGSPQYVGERISRIYTSTGNLTIILTIVDNQGITAYTSLDIEVLPATDIPTADAAISYTARYNRGLVGKDLLDFTAQVNVGDTKVLVGSTIVVSVAGKTFTATLDRKLKSNVGNAKFTVHAGLRRLAPGAVEIRLTGRNVTGLGTLLTSLLGALSVDDAVVPVHIEVAGKTFDFNVLSDYEVTLLKGKGFGTY